MRLKDPELLRRYIGAQGLGISEYELARRAGLSRPMINHLATGRRTTCSKRTAVRIEEALGCPTGLLFDESVSAVRADGRRPERVSA